MAGVILKKRETYTTVFEYFLGQVLGVRDLSVSVKTDTLESDECSMAV